MQIYSNGNKNMINAIHPVQLVDSNSIEAKKPSDKTKEQVFQTSNKIDSSFILNSNQIKTNASKDNNDDLHPVLQLGKDIWKQIFIYFDLEKERCQIALVCKTFKSLIEEVNLSHPPLTYRQKVAKLNIEKYLEICRSSFVHNHDAGTDDTIICTLSKNHYIHPSENNSSSNQTTYEICSKNKKNLGARIEPLKPLKNQQFCIVGRKKNIYALFQPKFDQKTVLFIKDLFTILESLNCIKNKKCNYNKVLAQETWERIKPEVDAAIQLLT